MLLLRGVDPYKAAGNESSTTVMQALQGHAHATPFADGLHALAMKASPPEGDGSIWDGRYDKGEVEGQRVMLRVRAKAR